MSAYYNEHDAKTAAWLRALIKAQVIADGDVDTRSIELVRPGDLRGFTQCHFFAGIGGWSYALRLAGWPDDRECWTGSCPCQPFSSAGTQAGAADPRDLWPVWFQLLKECRPDVVLGEQVEAAIAHGWYDRLCDDLEGEGYAVGAASLGAPVVGAFHIRQRLWFVADTEHARHAAGENPGRTGGQGIDGGVADARGERRQQDPRGASRDEAADGRAGRDGGQPDGDHVAAGHGADGELADADGVRPAGIGGRGETGTAECGGAGELADPHRERRVGERLHLREREPRPAVSQAAGTGEADGVGDADVRQPEQPPGAGARPDEAEGWEPCSQPAGSGDAGFWADAEWIPCRDGKARPAQSGIRPLVDGLRRGLVPSGDPSESYANASAEARVMRLRGYGNSVVPQLAAAFIDAYLEVR